MDKTLRKKILVVDDEKKALLLLGNILQRANYEVISAITGAEALNLVKENAPDLIILDIVLPDIDGTDIAATLAEDPATKDIPIIFLSGIIMKKGEPASGQKTGRNYIMAKPVTGPEILEVINRIFFGCS